MEGSLRSMLHPSGIDGKEGETGVADSELACEMGASRETPETDNSKDCPPSRGTVPS
jgi:hypothetical protein